LIIFFAYTIPQNDVYHILLQNENGPCPLLAAGNSLLLKKSITLPSHSIGAGVVTIEELTSVLAENILLNNMEGSDHHIQEMMTVFPKLQFGLDVNPKFTGGPTGVEYTMELNAFDLLRIELVHGWLLEPDAEEYEWIGSQTYNQLVNLVIEGNDASASLERNPHGGNQDELSTKATRGSIIHSFLERSAHQLTQFGLTVLHEYVKEGDMVVFFRNNHFNTLTKYNGSLYLLVTDFGYADVSSVVWEKLDVIDGDTEYVNNEFKVPPPIDHHVSDVATGEQLLSNDAQSQADFQLALQLSRESSLPMPAGAHPTTTSSPEDEVERATQASLWEHQQHMQRQGLSPVLERTSQIEPNPPGVTRTQVPPPLHPLDHIREIQRLPPSTTPTTADTQPLPTAPPTTEDVPFRAAVPCIPSVVEGMSAANVLQEESDMMFAMQLQRQEEAERQAAMVAANEASRKLAKTMDRDERDRRQQLVSRPGPPPHRQPTAPTAARQAKSAGNGNCNIS
jgi:hypothetical protein